MALRVDEVVAFFAFFWMRKKDGSSMPMRTAMMVTTTRISIIVKARGRCCLDGAMRDPLVAADANGVVGNIAVRAGLAIDAVDAGTDQDVAAASGGGRAVGAILDQAS